MTEVARQGDGHDPRVRSRRRRQHAERSIRAAVVDEDDLVRPAGNAIENVPQPIEQLVDSRLLVVQRNRDRKPHVSVHARRPPLK